MVATSALLTAAPASASHSYPATYSGSVAGGGSVEFDVSADGSAITRFKVTAVPTECGLLFSTFAGTPGVPIVDHAFSNTSSPLMFSGSFPAIQTAHGTVQERRSFPPCTSSPRGWNATTSAPAPAPAPDTTAPVIALSGRTTQRADGTVAVSVTSNEIGSGTATGTVIVRRTRRTAASFALGSAVTQLAPNVRARLKLRVPRRARTAIRKALRNGRRVSAVVTVSVRDAAGNSASRNRTVRLRRR